MLSNLLLNLQPASRTAQLVERRDAAVHYPARHDEVEVAEVGGVVEREAVTGDPARNPDANCGELFLTDPHARQTANAFRLDAVVGRDTNEHFLQIANVAMNVAPIRFQIDDRIADNLPRSVV